MVHAATVLKQFRYFLCSALLAMACCMAAPTAYAQWVRMDNIPAGYDSNHWLDVFFLPSNPRFGWICGYQSFVLRTVDGGKTWQGITADANSLQLESIHFASPTIGYTSGGGRILKTVDGGVSWFDVSPNDPFGGGALWGCYFVSPDTGVVVGGGCFDSRQNFYRTTDGGQSWSVFRASLPNSGMTDAMLYSGNGLGYASSSGTIWRTSNGGNTWSLFLRTGTTDWQEEITNIKSTFLVPVSGSPCGGEDSRGGIRMTIDNGANWRQYITGFNMYGTFLIDTLRGWACGGSGSVYYTPDGGLTWKKRDCGIHPTDDLDDIWFITDTLGWVVGNGVYKLETRAALPTNLTVEGKSAVCEGDSVVISAPPGYASYLWSTGETTRSIAVGTPGTYYAIATDSLGCPYDFDTVQVSILPRRAPSITAIGSLDFCKGDSVVLEAQPGFGSYLWSTGETTRSITVHLSGSYSVSAVSANGCDGLSDTIVVNVRPASNQLLVRTDPDGAITFDTVGIVGRFCRDIIVVNLDDTLAFHLDAPGVFFADNMYFSLPPGQFPIVIAPLDSVRLLACYTPSQPERESDTLIVADNCSIKRAVVFGSGGKSTYTVESQCDISLTLRTIAYNSFLLRMHPPAPNPASDIVRIPVTFQAEEPDQALLRCTLHDEFGTVVAAGTIDGLSTSGSMTYGEFILDVSHLAQGMYFISVLTPYGSSVLPLVVNK